MWGIDVSHTAHTGAQTGIQHVCRDLLRCFLSDGLAEAVIYDPYVRSWRNPDKREKGFLFPDKSFRPPSKRSGKWSKLQKLRGRLQYQLRWTHQTRPYDLLFCPELFDFRRDSSVFSPSWPNHLKRVAYFYDAIPIKFSEWTPAKTVARYPDYLKTLARFDHVACISESSKEDLHAAWKSLKIEQVPPTSAVPLGIPLNRILTTPLDFSGKRPTNRTPVVLMVGTLEARKNHLAVLEACEGLWHQGLDFELRLIGMLNKETGDPAARKIEHLVKKGHKIKWEGAVSNERLAKVYAEADLFLYPSLYEGFGLPVLEALAHGLPTIMTDNGALSALAGGGGCRVCGESPAGISDSLKSILLDDEQHRKLSLEARGRSIRTMKDTCAELTALFQELTDSPRS